MGYAHAYALDGGWQAWLDKGYPVEGRQGVVADRPRRTLRHAPCLIARFLFRVYILQLNAPTLPLSSDDNPFFEQGLHDIAH
jgi:hypothetical protein